MIFMIIKVRVTPNSKVELLEKVGISEYVLKVRERAAEGHANAAVVALLSSHFNVKKSSVSIIRGARSREKIIEVRNVK
jgi:uncharacterized protein YggU (UPF0235/DUF167 family)